MYRNILVPIDGSDPAEYGLREAIGLARELKARLVLLHVAQSLPIVVDMAGVATDAELRADLLRHGEALLAKALQHAQHREVVAQTVLREIVGGSVATVVLEEAQTRGCDLIVMGTHGRRGLRHLLLGSDAEAVVRHSTRPVLLVRHAEA